MADLFRRWPPALRALAAQALAFGLILLGARLGLRLPGWGWALAHGVLATGLGTTFGLPFWWGPVNLLLPFAVWLGVRHPLPGWAYLAALGVSALVFGGGLFTRVPLYNASRDAWRKLEGLLPAQPGFTFVDLGCGLGGPLAHLAACRPDAHFLGIEASPATFLLAWLRCLPHPNVRIRLGSLWAVDLSTVDVAYAFLSPAPMPRLWRKVQAEMRPGARFISHSFAVPGQPPQQTVPVAGRAGARLLVWQMESQRI
jgi:hypothetical protein